jgi:phosphoglycerate-specific signal transduction histidine kinase
VQDQERLIAAYGEENRAAVKQVKALEGRLREKDEEMRAQRQRLEAEVVRTVEAQQLRSAGTAAKLQCAPVASSRVCA